MFGNNVIVARTIENAWRDSMWCCIQNGYDYIVKQGSYVGQIRKQLPHTTIVIEEPWSRPLAPRMPEGCGIPPTTNEDKINAYFLDYILGEKRDNKEDYTYGQYIGSQVERIIDLLIKSNGDTNQACMQIGDASSCFLDNPPCLRVVSFKVINKKLQMSVFFRSWDLYAGLPENLGGLQLLKEYILTFLDDKFEDGPIVAYSDGLHIYEQYFSLVNMLNIDKIEI